MSLNLQSIHAVNRRYNLFYLGRKLHAKHVYRIYHGLKGWGAMTLGIITSCLATVRIMTQHKYAQCAECGILYGHAEFGILYCYTDVPDL
jgi:hypothetical protein